MEKIPSLKKTVVMIGLMGCGKSSVGKRLAKKMNVVFKDVDHVIEENEGSSVVEIFQSKGEDYFRQIEEKTVKDLVAAEEPIVLATGGGSYLIDEIRSVINANCTTVWIKADLDILAERVARKDTRPLLLGNDRREVLKELMEKRYPVYEQADIIVETATGPHNKVVGQIINKLNEHLDEE